MKEGGIRTCLRTVLYWRSLFLWWCVDRGGPRGSTSGPFSCSSLTSTALLPWIIVFLNSIPITHSHRGGVDTPCLPRPCRTLMESSSHHFSFSQPQPGLLPLSCHSKSFQGHLTWPSWLFTFLFFSFFRISPFRLLYFTFLFSRSIVFFLLSFVPEPHLSAPARRNRFARIDFCLFIFYLRTVFKRARTLDSIRRIQKD